MLVGSVLLQKAAFLSYARFTYLIIIVNYVCRYSLPFKACSLVVSLIHFAWNDEFCLLAKKSLVIFPIVLSLN